MTQNNIDNVIDCLHDIQPSVRYPTTTNPLPLSVWPHLCCGAGYEKRSGEQLQWSLAFRLYIGSLLHSYQDQFIQPGWTECVFVYLA